VVRQPSAPPSSDTTAAARSRGSLPEAVVVPALAVEAPVSAIRLAPDGALTPPADPQQVGWWSQGARPGASTGSAVLTGHTVHTGGGAFDDLEELVPGDEVVVRTGRGPLSYAVVSVRVLGRGELASRSAEVFEQSGAPRLVIITCEDWDGTAYLSNVVVTARPTTG
jgi:LPXTG-site transpeptidase (sortase) family protein